MSAGSFSSCLTSDKMNRGRRAAADRIRLKRHPLIRACIAECCGTAIMIIFGCGVLAQVVLGDHGSNKHGNFLSISLVWGLAVMLGVFFAGGGGSGNINPAVTLAFACLGRIPFSRVPVYTLSQIFGAFIGALTVFMVYHENIHNYAKHYDNNILSVNTTGNIFVTNPWASHFTCFVDQVVGTALLVSGALTIVDSHNFDVPDYLHPLYLGLLVCSLVGAFALNAGCALNPARDFGPRIMLALCGWGSQAFKAGNYYFWIPIIGPYLGAVIGAILYELTIGIHLTRAGELYD